MSLLAVIPARGGSKRLPRKNLRHFFGKPLIQWSVEAALASSYVDQLFVSTEDLEIAEVARSCGAEVPFLRPAELATDSAPGIAPVLHALDQFPQVSDVLLLQPTSPLRTSTDIDAIISLRDHARSESAVSITQVSKNPTWMYTMTEDHALEPLLEVVDVHSSIDSQPTYDLNGALYLASRSFLLREHSFICKDTVGYVMPPERSVDIDTLLDWHWAEFLMERY